MNPGELMQGTRELESDPLFKNMEKRLSDVSEADFSDISAHEMEEHAQYCAINLKDLKIAVIAPGDLLYGLARRFEILSNKENILVTQDMSEALSWLGVTLPEDF